MLPYISWRRVAILALIGMVCLPVSYPASGQAFDSGSEFEYGSPGGFYAAQQPEGAAEKAGAEPAAAPPDRPSPPARQPARRRDISSMLASRGPVGRLAGFPNMFGDSYGNQLMVGDIAGQHLVDIPPPAGARQLKIAENDKALPMDRVFFMYNHFQNAVEANLNSLGTKSYAIDQYTIGLEKTFREGLWSVELRMPFHGTPDVVGGDLIVGSGEVGNLAVTLKRLLYVGPTTAIGGGLAIGTPTGEDVTGMGAVSSYSLSNDAVHLAPFIGFLYAPYGRIFSEGFVQVDVPTNSNRVCFGGSNLGMLTEQPLLYVDFALGYWLHRNPYATRITGVAAMVEYHYTMTLEDADIVSGTDHYQILQFGNTANRLDISNITAGLHTELGLTTVRVGGVFPLSGGSNRLYDAEVQVSVNRRF